MTGEKNRFKTTEKLWDLDDKQLKSPAHDAMVLWLMDEKNSKDMIHNVLLKKNRVIDTWRVVSKEKSDRISCPYFAKDLFKVYSEVPIKSSNTFIAGYGDLVFKIRFSSLTNKVPPLLIDDYWLIESTKCGTVADMRELLSKFFNVKFDSIQYASDFVHRFGGEYYVPNGATEDDLDRVKERDFLWNVYREKYAEHFFEEEFKGCRLSRSTVVDWVHGDYDVYLSLEIGSSYIVGKEKHELYQSVLVEVKPYIDSFGAVLRQIKSYMSFSDYNVYCLFTSDNRFDSQFESQGIIVLHPPAGVSIDDMRTMYGL